MAQAMERSKVIELLEYYKDIDGEVSIYRKIINDLTDQYYNPIGPLLHTGAYYSISTATVCARA